LNYIRENLFSKIAKNKTVLTIVIIQLFCNKKMLKEINTKTKQKIQYLLFDIKKSNITKLSNCSAANTLIKIFSIIWFFLAILNNFSSIIEFSNKNIVIVEIANWFLYIFYCRVFFLFYKILLILLF